MLTHVVRHIFRMARPMNFKLGIRMDDDEPHQPQSPWPPRSKVARSHDQSEPSWPNAVPVSLEAGGGIPCRPNPAATLLVYHSLQHWTTTMKRREQNLIVHSSESEAGVANNRDCALNSVLLKLTTDRHEASRSLSATAGLLVCLWVAHVIKCCHSRTENNVHMTLPSVHPFCVFQWHI